MDNIWPDINEEIKTSQVIVFLKKIIDDLEDKYDGKIHASLEPIEYSTNLTKPLNQLSNIAKIIGVQEIKSDCEKKEEITTFKSKQYKFIIYTDINYYRLFEINVSEFFPVKIITRNALFNDGTNSNIIVDDQQEFENKIVSIIRSEFVRNLIMKMLSSLKNN